MIDEFEFTLHSPLTKEDWEKLLDAELENTIVITYQTPSGRQVKFIKREVLNNIRDEIEHVKDNPLFGMVSNDTMLEVILEIINKYNLESEDKE